MAQILASQKPGISITNPSLHGRSSTSTFEMFPELQHSERPMRRLEMELTMLDGREISVSFWVRMGDPEKSAVVILPGLDEHAITWRRVLGRFINRSNRAAIPELSDRTVVIINQRGQGPTRESELERYENPPRSIPRADQVMILRAVLQRLELENVILVGHSYGGSTALGALGEDDLKAMTRSVVLLAPHVSHFERYTTDHFMQMKVQAAAWLELLNPFAYEMSTAAYMPLFFEQALKDGDLSPFTRDWNKQRIGFLTAMTLGIMRIDTESDLEPLTDDPRPVHLMIAAHDRLVPVGAHQHLYDIIPAGSKGRFLQPEGTPHRIHLKAPDEVAELIAAAAAEADAEMANEALKFHAVDSSFFSRPVGEDTAVRNA